MPQTTHPLVSVVVPIYGVERYLRQCVDSILAQTLQDIEIILVDDGSPDACPQIVDEYAAADSRVRAIHKSNGGYGQTCNVGLEAARGEYIGIVEPDDYIAPEMYEELYAIAKRHDSDIVKSCYYNLFDLPEGVRVEKESSWKTAELSEEKSFTLAEHAAFVFYHPSIWSCIYKAEFMKRHAFRFKEVPGAGWTDNPFQLATLCKAERINYTDKAFYYYRRFSDNPSEELRDKSLPFARMDDMRQWVSDNNITDVNILGALTLRELYYIYVIIQGISHRQYKQFLPEINRAVERMDLRILEQCPYTTREHLRQYHALCRGQYWRYLYPSKVLRRMMFSLNVKKGDFNIQLLGVQIASAEYRNRPSLLKFIVR